MPETSRQHWFGFDYVKGLLLLFVFIGHIIPGKIEENLIRYIIYAFHIPIFIGISGFLLNISKFQNLNYKEILIKYWNRIVFPWIIAVLVYHLIYHYKTLDLSLKSLKFLLYDFISPYYHLWYIPGILSYILISYILFKAFKCNKYKWVYIITIAFIISIISKFNVLVTYCTFNISIAEKLLNHIHLCFRLYNFLYFAFGLYLREKCDNASLSDKHIRLSWIIFILSSIINIFLFFTNNETSQNIFYYLLNLPLLYILVFYSIKGFYPECKFIEFIGIYSLPIYLYHILCKIFSGIIFLEGSLQYYVLNVTLFVCLCFTVYFLRKINCINKFIFGSTNSALIQI